MASRKLVRDFFFSKQIVFHQFRCRQLKDSNLRASPGNGYLGIRQLSILNEFSKKLKGEAQSNPEFRQSIKEIEQKAEKLKEVKEDLKVRTKQTTEQMYKRMDGVWIEAEATAKKVSANIKEKLSATKEEVKETFGLGNQNSSSTNDSRETGSENQDNSRINYAEGNPSETIFSKFKSGFSTTSPKVSSAFEKLKDTKIVDLAKQGYDIVKDELTGKPSRKKQAQYASSASKEGRSTRTDIVVVPTKQSRWGKKWEAFKNKMHNHPIFKRVSGISEPVMTKSHEFAEDVRERWETSDHPVVHKIQDLNETMFGETAAAQSFKEIRRRDPSFSLPEFLADVQEMIRPTLNAYFKGDVEILKKNCSPEVIERCKAERTAYESQGIFFDNKLLHISDAEIRETKLMGTTPIIIVAFQTQQVYCVRDRHGSITEGGKDTIHTVFYAWAMQQVDAEELGEGALFPIWRLREMQQLGMQALI